MNRQKPKNILVYRLSALGDVAMTIPAIYSCARTWPDTTFHVVTASFCAQLFVRAPQNVVLHPIEKPVGTWRLLKALSKIKVDAVADLHNVLRSWLVDTMFLMKGKRVVMLDKRRNERRAVLGHQLQARPYVERYFDVFARLRVNAQPSFKSLFSKRPTSPVNMDKGSERWIGIAPFARYDNKAYPQDKMQEVIRMLVSDARTRVFLFGSRGHEEEILKSWAIASDRIEVVAGRFSLTDELALMSHMDTMLTMDSSNHHLASLVGTRVVSVWGSTTPACGFMGWGQQMNDALISGVDCQPCTTAGSKRCRLGTLACMHSLSPESIVEKLIAEPKTIQ